jgi:hypothetical protein
MNNLKKFLIIPFLTLTGYYSFGQEKSKFTYYFEDPIQVDSSSTIIIPTRYSADFISSKSKFSMWHIYANIIFYDFTNDSVKKLFDKDTYIVEFSGSHNETSSGINIKKHINSVTTKWLFYTVKSIDNNKNGHIDNNDPAILYVSDIHGDNLKALTTEKENVVGIDIFEKHNFALVKIQRDLDNDGNFESEDKDFYFVKLDLTTLTTSKKIEAK